MEWHELADKAEIYVSQFGVEQVSLGAPIEYEGPTSDGKKCYFRSRGNSVTFGVGSTNAEAVENSLLHTFPTFRLSDRPYEASWLELDRAIFILAMYLEMHRRETLAHVAE